LANVKLGNPDSGSPGPSGCVPSLLSTTKKTAPPLSRALLLRMMVSATTARWLSPSV
jgi:hypothetical protein